MQVTLADGAATDLTGLAHQDLWELQFEQECAFADRIKTAPKGSPVRAETIRQGYDTVCGILAAMHPREESLVMGLDFRYVDLVLELLGHRAFMRTGTPALFKIGYAAGGMLASAAQAGYDVAGIEVCEGVRRQALKALSEKFHSQLHLGDLIATDLGPAQYDVVYWNDVFEHVPPDEIRDYLARIYRLLLPGGYLVTITPNWHERPSDVTGDFLPPRSEARGLHLKEYTLREVTALLRETGFTRVETPLVVTKGRIVLGLGGLSGLKRLCEPCLEWIPYRCAELLCHGLGLSYTIATKA